MSRAEKVSFEASAANAGLSAECHARTVRSPRTAGRRSRRSLFDTQAGALGSAAYGLLRGNREVARCVQTHPVDSVATVSGGLSDGHSQDDHTAGPKPGADASRTSTGSAMCSREWCNITTANPPASPPPPPFAGALVRRPGPRDKRVEAPQIAEAARSHVEEQGPSPPPTSAMGWREKRQVQRARR